MSDEENADFFELSNPLRDALETINEFLHHGTKTPTKAAPETEQQLQQQNKQIDWAFKVCGAKIFMQKFQMHDFHRNFSTHSMNGLRCRHGRMPMPK